MKMVMNTRLGVTTLFIAAFLLSFSVHFAQAGIIYNGTNFDIQISDPVNVGNTPLKAVTITAFGKNGALPNAFDGTRLGGTGISTTSDLLHQIWEFGAAWTPTNTLIVSNSIPQNLDSHFLVGNDKIISISAPAENRGTLSTLENAFGGFGNSLNGVFSLKGTPTNSTWDIAYLVVPNNTQLKFKFSVGANGYASELVNTTYTVVPEPNTIAMLTAGCISLLVPIWRRKK